MKRLALGIEYVGTNYSGWQVQAHQVSAPSIQAQLEFALTQIAGHPVHTICAGRTDAGVHACGQVVHCDVMPEREMRAWVFGCNSKLPRDIRVCWAREVTEDFDARRSALSRHYRYIVYNHSIRPSLMNEYVTWYCTPLEVELMREAARSWLGEHDFSSFRGAGCQSKSAVRRVEQIEIRRSGELVIFDIVANAFLYHMIRNMIGVLLPIGAGKRPVSWAHEVLCAVDRKCAGVTAPAQGLYLFSVAYPDGLQIPRSDAGLWFFNQGVTI